MSELYLSATTDARKNPVTARAHKKASVHLRGWEHGIELECLTAEDGTTTYHISVTGGSNGGPTKPLGRIVFEADGAIFDHDFPGLS